MELGDTLPEVTIPPTQPQVARVLLYYIVHDAQVEVPESEPMESTQQEEAVVGEATRL